LCAEQLRRRCRTGRFPFSSTAEGLKLEGIIGQERATRAIEFGLDVPYPGYNIYALGPAGAGKGRIISYFLESKAATCPVPPDWGYVHNFDEPDCPNALRLPPGGGARLRSEVDELLAQAGEALDKVFVGDEYAERHRLLERELNQGRDERLGDMEQVERGQGFEPVHTSSGLRAVPAKEGRPLTREQFDALPQEERVDINQRRPPAEEIVERTLRRVRELEEEAAGRFKGLDKQTAAATLCLWFDSLLIEYAAWPDVTRYLARVQAHITEHAGKFKPVPRDDDEDGEHDRRRRPVDEGAGAGEADESPFDCYRLNLLVDNQGLTGAPVIAETNPTYANLIGRVEMRHELGTWVGNSRQIKAGALHRANGGYLVLDARALLRQPLAWDALKQALSNGRIRMEDMAAQPGIFVQANLRPESIPLDVKVVLIGDANTYYLLYAADDQFEKLFKVRADFAVDMGWTEENELRVAEFIHERCDEEKLPHFDVSAVAEVIEYSARLCQDQRKLTTRFALVGDIVREAAFWGQRAGHSLVMGDDVRKAVEERVYRSSQFQEHVRALIADGTIMVDTDGAVVGQVNGLAILQLGDYEFGKPTRITARTFQGRAGVINVEREAHLSGRIHDKGLLILAGFLGGRYAQDKPLSLSASLAFEQSYDGVDGDSASSSELYALLSSLAGLPIKQGIAVTGSVNQRGEVQAIGAATAKIEGYFEACRAAPTGLTGEQGVIIPAANVPNLMLREDVIQAVAGGQFHIYPVRSIDEGIEILTGVPAGGPGADGAYPPESVNGRVDRQLRDLAEKLQRFGQPPAREKVEQGPTRYEKETPPYEPDLPGDRPEPMDG
jgi:lon-related putative ATP-dependent protease